MIITNLRTLFNPPLNKTVLLGDKELIMYVEENIAFVFKDIYDPKSDLYFSPRGFLIKHKIATDDELNRRLVYFENNKIELIRQTLSDKKLSLFFNSIEQDKLMEAFEKGRFCVNVELYIDGKSIAIDEAMNDERYKYVISYWADRLELIALFSARQVADIGKGEVKYVPDYKDMVVPVVLVSVSMFLLSKVGKLVSNKLKEKKEE